MGGFPPTSTINEPSLSRDITDEVGRQIEDSEASHVFTMPEMLSKVRTAVPVDCCIKVSLEFRIYSCQPFIITQQWGRKRGAGGIPPLKKVEGRVSFAPPAILRLQAN